MKRACAGGRATRSAEFPGEIAGASLKRARRRAVEALRGQFPGEIAGASLKRVW